MTPVKSSNIKAVGYDPASRALTVAFTNGGTYRYADVDPHQHERLIAADSIGSHFHTHIRNAHKSSKVEDQ